MSYPFWYQSRFGITRRLNVPTPAPLSGYIAEGPSQGSFNQKIPWAVPEEIAAEKGPLDGYFGQDDGGWFDESFEQSDSGVDTASDLYAEEVAASAETASFIEQSGAGDAAKSFASGLEQQGNNLLTQAKQALQQGQTDLANTLTQQATGLFNQAKNAIVNAVTGGGGSGGGQAAGAGGTYMAQQFVQDPMMQQQLCGAMSPPATPADCAIWGLPWGGSSGPSVQIALRKPTSLAQQRLAIPNAEMAMQMQTKAQAAAACANNGGVMLPYSDGKTYCQPSPATKAACTAAGGTPTWDPDNKYKCPPISPPPIVPGNAAAAAAAAGVAAPAAAGGLGASLPLIAGAGLLALLLMRR